VTSRTKRCLAVLALALGLVATAPYVFHLVADHRAYYRFGAGRWLIEARSSNDGLTRSAELWVGPFRAAFDSQPPSSGFAWMNYANPSRSWGMSLPHESITLRVGCAVALAGMWLLVLCGRLLARRWTRNPPDVGV
jgi:hypothetical protein